ncbi:tropomyosin-2 [Eurytemora carolleeae]|uniref:tropomyosin-2 n=1 Tax=Eurytemora carolleeae TaxID=1294199 RepID=UPI000C79070C|nr:tropomyosin-2 [Eurytemora carolleeae]|eukprot:XP_023320493.1 tropomyosin-2-like [Eurytemora affinis]
MDNIRKKMQSLKYETDGMIKSSAESEDVTKEYNRRSDQCDCDIRDLTKKISKLECAFDETHEKLLKASTDLEVKEKEMKEKEEDLSTLSRRIILMEEEVKKSEDKLAKTTLDLGLESKRADRILKTVNTLNSRSMSNEMEIEQMNMQEKEAKAMWQDADKKYDEISRRLGVMEEELRKAVERVENSDKRVRI